MRLSARVTVAALGLAVAAAIALAALFARSSPATVGQRQCVLRSIDRATYVAANERVLARIPLPADARLLTSYSLGTTSPHSCLPVENGPPYGSYNTWHVYQTPRNMTDAGVIALYLRTLARGWSIRHSSRVDALFRGRQASLYVSTSRRTFSLSVDHAALGGH